MSELRKANPVLQIFHGLKRPGIRVTNHSKTYLRFPLPARIEHWLFMASFTILGITGLVQKYAQAILSKNLVSILGGIEDTRLIHHIAATVMLLIVVYHLGILGYKMFVLRVRPTMLPGLNDIRNAIQSLTYNLGLSKKKPQQGRYTFEEKVEYWSVVWGTVIMAVTGFMMWNPITTSRFFAGQLIPAAKAAHGGEALLAVLAIIIWHLYHVIVRRINPSMFTGRISEEEMLEDHPLELADIKAGLAERPVDKKTYEKRLRNYLPGFGGFAVILLAGIYFFIAGEKTAIATIPPSEDVKIFAQFTPTPLPTALPTSTPPALGSLSWEGGIASLFQQKCLACHNNSAKIGGLDLSTYAGLLAGGKSGAAVLSGNPDASLLVIKQSMGNHPGQLSGDELTLIRNWILAGAPQ